MAINRRLLIVLTGWAAVSLLFAAWLTFSWGGIESTQRFDDGTIQVDLQLVPGLPPIPVNLQQIDNQWKISSFP